MPYMVHLLDIVLCVIKIVYYLHYIKANVYNDKGIIFYWRYNLNNVLNDTYSMYLN